MNGSVVFAAALLAGCATTLVDAAPVGQSLPIPAHGEWGVATGPDGCVMERTIAATNGKFVPSTVSLLNPDDTTVRLLLVAEAFDVTEGLLTDVSITTGKRIWSDGEVAALSVRGRPALMFSLPADFLSQIEREGAMAVTIGGAVRGSIPLDGAAEAVRRLTACTFARRPQ